jgi:hypothetical protein
MIGGKERFRQTLGAVETRVLLGEDTNSSPEKRKSYWQRKWAQKAVCRLLARNVGSLAVIVSSSLGLLAQNVSRKRPLFAGSSATVCRPLQLGYCVFYSPVVHELFAHANESVLVVGYAVYQGQRVFQALADRMQTCPALNVRLFLDIQRSHSDTTTANELVARFAERFREHQWPRSRPLPNVYYYPRSLELSPDKRTALHTKCVVVDGQTVFVSSANFTEAAHERNIEIGLLLRSKLLAERIVRYFDVLVSEGFLRSVY